MKQKEMSLYLKGITLGIGILFLAFIILGMPEILNNGGYGKAEKIVVWISAVPCFLCLFSFWGICVRIGKDQSFTMNNAKALKHMSYFMAFDSIIYIIVFVYMLLEKLFTSGGIITSLGILILIGIFISLAVICACLSHLVYKASLLQDEQNLTI